jgi:hypothetical protein
MSHAKRATTPIESVARTASTPAEAKVFAAMLQAEGIPARIEGDSLVDEFAASRRLMNLIGTRVMVPTSSLERAKEILQPAEIDLDELTRQALAEPRQETMATAAPMGMSASTRRWTTWSLLALLGLPALCAAIYAFTAVLRA